MRIGLGRRRLFSAFTNHEDIRNMIRRYESAAALVIAGLISACNRQDLPSTVRPSLPSSASHVIRPVRPAAVDSVMGQLSPIAQHLAAGLQDSTIRMAVYRAMKSPGANHGSLDLQTCAADPAVSSLVTSGERHGAGPAVAMCALIARLPGATLYMDPTQLARWDGTTIPIVTAVEKANRRLPATIRGYRSPDLLMDLPTDGSLQGPVLVVVPIAHPSRLSRAPVPGVVVTHHPNPPANARP
jgi:hypothetical protein